MRKKIALNSKVTKTWCVRCQKAFNSHRNDAKFCTDLCRVQEGIERKENNMVELVLKGSKSDLQNYLHPKYSFSVLGVLSAIVKNPNEFYPITEALRLNNVNQEKKSWKIVTNEYWLYCFPNIKKYPFELYFTKQKKFAFNLQNQPLFKKIEV